MENGKLERKRSETIRRIVDAATAVFAEVGFAGARIDDIAHRAGVNKAMIYYRIGDKEALYGRVLHDVFSDTTTRIARHIKNSQSPEEKLKTYIRNLAKTMENHVHVPPIIMRELASGAGHFPEIVIKDILRLLDILSGILEEGVRKGIFVETNPFLIHMMLVGAVVIVQKVKGIHATHRNFPEQLKGMIDRVSTDVSGDMMTLILRAVKK